MVVSIPARKVTTESIYVDRMGKHAIEAVREIRGQVALLIDGIWNYFHAAARINVIS